MDFKTWLLLEGYEIFDGEVFIEDVKGDDKFPITDNFDIMLRYLNTRLASREAKQSLLDTYEEYYYTCKYNK